MSAQQRSSSPQRMRFHHRHLPSLTRWTHSAAWKFAHLYFPMLIHVLTDKYERRMHHLAIDIVYGVLTFMLVGVNIGLGIWSVLYFTPAETELHIAAPAHVTSGNRMQMHFWYVNVNRDVQDVAIDLYLPDGLVTQSPAHIVLGDMRKGQEVQWNLEGTLFGHVGATHDVLAVVSYTSYNRRQTEPFIASFVLQDSTFDVAIVAPTAITYDEPVQIEIQYANKSDHERRAVEFFLQLPADLSVTAVTHNGEALEYHTDHHGIHLSSIAARESGSILVKVVFRGRQGDAVVLGDKQVRIAVDVLMQTVLSDADTEVITAAFYQGNATTRVEVVVPRLRIEVTGDERINFGETISARVSVRNVGDSVIERIQLRAAVEGAAVVPTRATGLMFSVIETLAAGEEKAFDIRIPTTRITDEEVESRVIVSGTGFSPALGSVVLAPQVQLATKFNSHVTLDAEVLYEGPNGEQFGYGPYPPQAWEMTAFRLVLRIHNTNNVLSNVRVRTQLPEQVEWTGFSSVSTGTHLTWNEDDRSVEWTIPSLQPNNQESYGAQFEIRFTPNHLQIGLTPNLLNEATIRAQDAFTGGTLTQSTAAVVSPAAIVE